jgi:predicted metalloprotease with PDZ domain
MALKRNRARRLALMILCLAIVVQSRAVRAQGDSPIALDVDAREAPRGIWHARMTMPVKQGPLTLIYPKWIPGQHRPSGVIVNLVGLKVFAGGRPALWRRDEEEMFAFHVEVPAGATELVATYDFLAPPQGGGYPLAESTTSQLAILNWNQVVLYPQGKPSDDIRVAARLRLPAGWRFATALPTRTQSGGEIAFESVSLTTLVDSPLLAGANFRLVNLKEGQSPVHEIAMASDSAAALEMKAELVAKYSSLVDEARALFGAHHYNGYRWLVTLSDFTSHFGLEHHESSDNRIRERALLTDGGRRSLAGLLSHEYVHSWNGKYRRPAGLATPAYHQPMKGELLWVYEGLTEYLGNLLAPRAGLWTADEFRDSLANMAANMDYTAGRNWRPLADTAVGAPIAYGSPRHWRAYRRATDFYIEGPLIWLEADVLIRQRTQGRRSLDDFCRNFFGGESGPPQMKPYTFDDVVAALDALLPYDWAEFFNRRINDVTPHAPLAGIADSGWKLVYTDKPNTDVADREETSGGLDLAYSIGLRVNREGVVEDVVPGLAADKAGLAPRMKLIAVNGRKWSTNVLRAAIAATESGDGRLELLAENAEFYKTYPLDYHDGERHPHLERDASKPDLLSEIIKSRIATPQPDHK